MRVLLFSILVYLAGVVTLLYYRPSYMFKEDGSWKEFSLQASNDTTPFPIWAFCIIWALLSYAVVRFFVGDTVKSALESIPLPSLPSSVAAAPTLKPGYYLLNREGSAESGFPRYVYIGPEQATGPPETN
jgi:hypothetical protein